MTAKRVAKRRGKSVVTLGGDRLQYSFLRDTVNAPTVPDEEKILESLYGKPNENGVYGQSEDGEE